MNFANLKRRAADATLNLMSNDKVRRAVDTAMGTGQQIVGELKTLGEEVRRHVDASRDIDDDTAELKERLDNIRED